MKEQATKLKPWISFDRRTKGPPRHIVYESLQDIKKSCTLISIISIQPQQIHMIDNLQLLSTETQLTPLVYLSEINTFQGRQCRVIFIPPNKAENQSVQFLSDIMRDLSDVVISDINNSGVSRMRRQGSLMCQKFVLVNGKDIYLTEFGEGQIQLVQKVETPLLSTFKYENSKTRDISLDYVQRSIEHCQKQWQLLMGGDKSWSKLALSTLQHYKAVQWIKNCCEQVNQMREKHKLLSNLQLELIQRDLVNNYQCQTSWELQMVKQVADEQMAKLRLQNFKNTMDFLQSMKHNCFSLTSAQDLLQTKQNIKKHLQLFGISEQFADYIICERQKELVLKEKDDLNSQILHLNKTIADLQKKLLQKTNQIKDFKLELEEYCSKFVHLIETQKKYSEIVRQLKILRQKNEGLSYQLNAHLVLEKQYLENKQKLEEKVKQAEKQQRGMIECLRQLTQESLGLHNTIERQRLQIQELKNQVKDNTSIQIRALRSIQNEAEIKTRLQRYENYVSDLKLNLKSYRRLESEKFNYILSHNYKEYTKLKEKYQALFLQFQKQKSLNQELAVGLQRQKTRMAYFQKFLRSNYNTEPIPQCSQENSATDRDSQQIAVE